MKEKLLPFRQIEWWLMTILIFLIVLTNTLGAKVPLERLPHSSDLTGKYFAYIMMPLALYAAFYLIHMKIFPAYQQDGQKAKMILYTLLTFLGSWFVVGLFYVGAGFGDTPLMPFFFTSIVIYVGYLLAVRIVDQLYILAKSTRAISYNAIRCILLYNFAFLFLTTINNYYHKAILIGYAVGIPIIVLLLLYNYFLIFRMKVRGKTKVAKAYTLFLPITLFILATVASLANGHGEIFIVGALVSLFILAIFNPLVQAVFYRYYSVLGRIDHLTNQLDQKSADLQFLRSQINPHFLFNALNSLYGMALQESSERTAEGIQKLGDMMRFMLHENNQNRIAVEREKEYLINYVDLQLLRTREQENIEIIFNRSENNCNGEIAPMMLIPFVENAFKHGISLQKKSWVKISLRCLENEVHMDINNSIHRAAGDDPERQASGIGLANVKQRLNLLYPDRHELIIRENELEYFVHLSIQLK